MSNNKAQADLFETFDPGNQDEADSLPKATQAMTLERAPQDSPPPKTAHGGGDSVAGYQFTPLPPPPDGEDVEISQFAQRAYLEYAVSTIHDRSLPDVRDGQKPVQRRILYAMLRMGIGPTTKPVKSARVVGDVMGKYHPHGDASSYEAAVRMAQDFSLRYPLIDGQGNFGSRDGDNPAAMRYTEMRLTVLANLLLSEIDMGTVDFRPNYDGAFQEPASLPARLPMVLLNGASGIAVGMATETPSHNLREVAAAAAHLARNPSCKDDELLSFIPGPDLPGGGQIISPARDIRECYLAGRGSIKVRARWTVEPLARGQWQIAVYELPRDTSTKRILEELEELTSPKIKAGKKAVSPEQAQNKQLVLGVLESVRDESDKTHKVRLVFEPKSSRQSQDEMMTILLALTSLTTSIPVNLTMIGLDGRPHPKPLSTILREWVESRLSTVRRRTQFRLGQVEDRLHILAGRMIVFLNLDEVIRIIRESDEPKPALVSSFDLSETQAEDILEIRLRQLARMEGIRIEKEIKTLEKEQRELKHLLESDARMRALVASEIEADAAQYGDDRRTLIEEVAHTEVKAPVLDEPVTVIISRKHWVRTRPGHNIDLAGISFKEGDQMDKAYECRTTDHCIVLCDTGRACSIPVNQLPAGKGDGAPLASFIELNGSRIVHAFCGNAAQQVLISTSAGYGFICAIGDMVGRNRAGKQFITLDDASLLQPHLFSPEDNSLVASITNKGKLLLFRMSEMKNLSGGGKGDIIQHIPENAALTAAVVINKPALQVLVRAGSREQKLPLSDDRLQEFFGKRAQSGKLITSKATPLGLAS